jgi:hypothetical protein
MRFSGTYVNATDGVEFVTGRGPTTTNNREQEFEDFSVDTSISLFLDRRNLKISQLTLRARCDDVSDDITLFLEKEFEDFSVDTSCKL